MQLRMKNEGRGTRDEEQGRVYDVAREIMKLKRRYDFTFIVNDFADIALDVGADGVHVGENDEAVASIRGMAGDRLIVGYSSHSIDEARRAARDGADYVAFGAIFPTRTKGPGHPVQGIDRLRELVRSVNIPVVAIGGINRGNVRQVIDAGASAAAMITALSQARDVVEETGWFVEKFS